MPIPREWAPGGRGAAVCQNQTQLRWSVGQLQLNHATFSQLPAADSPLAGITRLIRRVCLLREHGDAVQAGQLCDTGLADAVRDYRLAHGPEALPEGELQAMFVVEERRVAEAAILSELMVPRLVACFPRPGDPVRSTRPRSEPERDAGPAGSPSAPAGPPHISDLLDAMLAAERNASRMPAAGQRESRNITTRT